MAELIASIICVILLVLPITVTNGAQDPSNIIGVIYNLNFIIQFFSLGVIIYIILKMFKVKSYIKSVRIINFLLFVYWVIFTIYAIANIANDHGVGGFSSIFSLPILIISMIINSVIVRKISNSNKKSFVNTVLIIHFMTLILLCIARILIG